MGRAGAGMKVSGSHIQKWDSSSGQEHKYFLRIALFFLPYVATGEQIVKLCSWLAAAHAVCEAPLSRALRSAPLPRASNKQRMLAGPELEPLRSDGYRTLVSRLFLSLKMKSRLLSPY